MTKAELVSRIAEEAQMTKKDADLFLSTFVASLRDILAKEGEIRIQDLGTFKVMERKARTGVNPQTKTKMEIPATKAPTFRAAKSLKEAVNSGD